MDNMNVALELLVVGMVSVFTALLIVIYLGKLLIWVINKYFQEEEKPKAVTANVAANVSHRAAIEKAVAIATGNKARVEKIEKI